MNEILQSKEDVLRAFQTVLAERKKSSARITTKEEIAKKERDNQLVAVAAAYTADSIVKGLANLQLEFDTAVANLSEQLQKELAKWEALRAAIAVETARLKEVSDIKIAASALHILRQEQQAKEKAFAEEVTQKWKAIEEETALRQMEWQKEQKEQEQAVQERNEQLKKERQLEAADYKYKTERTNKLEMDAYEERRKSLERELREKEQEKVKDWSAREKLLAENEPKLAEYRAKVDNFENELREAVTRAREEASKNAAREAKIKADLLEKEVDGTKQIYQLQIQSLEATLAKQAAQIEALATQLKEALAQVQGLSVKALEKG
jgi:hypothetical protein